MLSLLKKWNTLRNQILIVFLFVMVIVLVIVGILTFNRVSMLLKNNAEDQIQQVAIEANGRFESLFEQLNMITKQLVTNEDVQNLLLSEVEGNDATFNQRQALMERINTIHANADGIYTVEIYTKDYQKIIPLGEGSLTNRIDPWLVERADELKGKILWIGQDEDSDSYLAIRRVSLMDQNFSNGGYLLVRVNKNYFQLNNEQDNEYTILVDQNSNTIVSNYNGDINKVLNSNQDTIQIEGNDYILTKQSSNLTGWTLAILTPVSALTKGISILRTVIIVSGVVGFMIFTVCSFFLSTVITRPIIKLTTTMRKASEGILTLNPKISSTNEINELNNTYNQLVEETNHLIQMVYEKELTRSRTELKALQAQINPHFLFNTLDSLYWSLEEKDEEELAELVFAMSGLFRYTITHINKGEWVTIKEEMEHAERYIQIMEMRFGDRLTWKKLVPEQWEKVKIPKLIIQPLVENAILHGAGNTVQTCHVSVIIEKSKVENMLSIKVIDDGPGMDQEKVNWLYQSMNEGVSSVKGNGIAISNVQKRLQLYYQKENLDGLVIESEINKGTSVSFDIPIYGGME
ncbi:HAMP domain-containing protein [Aquibacillus halophilus]|uniref:histidine kinase n=1 Tax=Aquibacillus halophilus TaxID=930132 RepID=A0A6A8DL05_9BACI|nr:sensor histidine kinase [Aquibacillus halophilus]MRH41922.1 HAMP domain-containing protein [Aquibacillus halophilus]